MSTHYSFRLGRGAALRTGRDVGILSTGLMTIRALDAAERLARDHIDVSGAPAHHQAAGRRHLVCRVVDGDRLVVTAENHTIVGGLAEAVASTVAFAGLGTRIVPIALPDQFLAAGALPTRTTVMDSRATPSSAASCSNSTRPPLPGTP